jgi:uncharacterized protein involved in exopolysaccharide biosynthesis
MQGIWRCRWLTLAVAWTVCLLGFAVIALWPSSYMSSAVIYVDPDHLAALEQGTGDPAARLHRALLAEIPAAAQALSSSRRATLEADLRVRATTPPIYAVAYDNDSPAAARDMLSALVGRLVSAAEAQAEAGIAAIDQEIDAAREEVEAVKAELQKFGAAQATARRNNDEVARSLADRQSELARLEQQLEEAEQAQEALAGEIQALEEAASQPPAPDPAALAELEQERTALEQELEKLTERYADSHPYVVTVREAIAEVDARAAALPLLTADEADASEDLQEQRALQTSRIAALSADMAFTKREIDRLELRLEEAPVDQAELDRLQGERETLEQGLNALLERRAAAAALATAETAPVRLLKAPEPPMSPVGPSRVLLLAGVMAAGLAAAAAAAAIYGRAKGTFETAAALQRRFDVDVLGTLANVLTPKEQRRLGVSRFAFGLGSAALVGLFGGLVIAASLDRLAPWGDQIRAHMLG